MQAALPDLSDDPMIHCLHLWYVAGHVQRTAKLRVLCGVIVWSLGLLALPVCSDRVSMPVKQDAAAPPSCRSSSPSGFT